MPSSHFFIFSLQSIKQAGKRKGKVMTTKKSSGRSEKNDAGMSTIPCELPMDRPDTVDLRPTRKPYRIDRVQVDESPDGLPEGWIMEIRPRKRCQRTDKYYIDPVHGYGLLSKVDVYRYLQNKEEFQVGYRIERIHTADDYFTTDESIPILRLRKRNRSSETNPNIPQIASSSWEPVSTSDEGKKLEQCHEHIMDDNLQTPDKDHSKLEGKGVPHPDGCTFEEKKNQLKKVSKPSKRKVEKATKEPVRKSKRLANTTNCLLFSNDSGKSSGKPKSKKIEKNMQTTMPKKMHEETSGKAHTDDDPEKKDTPKSVEIQYKSKNLEPSAEQASQNQNTSLIVSTSTIRDTQSDLDESILEEKQNQSKNANRPPKGKMKNIEAKPARTSKRLAGEKNDFLFDNDTEKGSVKLKSKKFEQSMQQTMPKELDEEKLCSINHVVKETSQKMDTTEKNAAKSDNISEECTNLSKSPPGFGVLWSDPCIEFAFKTLTSDLHIEEIQKKPKNVQHSMEQASRKQLHVNPPLKTLGIGDSWLDPCIEFAFKTLTSDLDIEDAHVKEGTQEKFDNITQPSVEQASQKQQCTDPIMFGDSWSDPCIEFAFRTLTSDFSSLEDITSVQDYFHRKPFLSQCSNAAASVSALSVSDGKTQSLKNGEV